MLDALLIVLDQLVYRREDGFSTNTWCAAARYWALTARWTRPYIEVNHAAAGVLQGDVGFPARMVSCSMRCRSTSANWRPAGGGRILIDYLVCCLPTPDFSFNGP